MKKYINIFIYLILLIGSIAFIIGFSRAWNAVPTISAAGSTSVQPLLTFLSSKYDKADINVSPGGSSFGIKVAAKQQKEIGTASRDPYKKVEGATIEKDGYSKYDWINNEMKTITFGWDGVCIVYKTSNEFQKLTNYELSITDNNIFKIYELFSGNLVSFSEIIPIDDFNNMDSKAKELAKTIITPYARSGGAGASGTAHTFLESFKKLSVEDKKNEWFDILTTGKYKPNVVSTNESNIESWNRFVNENKDFSIIYLSTAFVKKNKELIRKKGYKIAKYKGITIDGDGNDKWSEDNYGWVSPMNLMFSLKNFENSELKEFISWLLGGLEKIPNNNINVTKKLIEDEGYFPINDKERNFFFNEQNDKFESDYNLKREHFGAIKLTAEQQ